MGNMSERQLRPDNPVLQKIRDTLILHEQVTDAEVAYLPALSESPVVAVSSDGFISGPEVRQYIRAALGNENMPGVVVITEPPLRADDSSFDLATLVSQPPSPAAVYRFATARSAIERWLAHRWSALLGWPEVGIFDDFLELGGDSLSATTVLTEIHEHYGVELLLSDIFQMATIEQIATAIEAAASTTER
jgi:hypothetical protein